MEKNTVWSDFTNLDSERFYRRVDIIPARNDRYTLATYSDPEGNNEFNIDLLSFSSDGLLNWKKAFDEDGFIERTTSVIQLENGDFMILSRLSESFSFSTDKFSLLKFTEDGDFIWSKIIEDDRIASTEQLFHLPSDNSILVLTEHDDGSNLIDKLLKLHKFDDDGNKIWTKPILSSAPIIFSGTSFLEVTEAEEIYVAYSSAIVQNDYDLVVTKLSADADILWEKVYPGAGTDLTEDMVKTRDGNLVLLSSITNTEDEKFDVLATKLSSSDGSILWEKSYGSISSDFGHAIVQRENGNLVIMGNTNHDNINEAIFDFFILETDEEGNPI